MAPKKNGVRPAQSQTADNYEHKTADSPMRPDVGTQAQFRKRKPAKTYRYDTSLDPALSWDGSNGSRELGEWLLARIEDAAKLPAPHLFPEPKRLTGTDGQSLAIVRGLEDAIAQLKAIERPFLNWSGKAERLSFDVPTLPLFIHERLSTKAILETLKGHKREGIDAQMALFGDPQHSIVDQTLGAYEYRDGWVNRMILGDSLAVMNSLAEYEGMRGQVQMIYIDPPYGVKFGSNFQPFVRKREVNHSDDNDLTREPEMVQAYRDTWELGLHSYLTYLRDRLLLARDLLSSTGSIFVQISDENLHHVRELMAEVFGPENFIVCFLVKKTGSQKASLVEAVNDYLVWFAKDISKIGNSFNKLYERTPLEQQVAEGFNYVELTTGEDIPLSELHNQHDDVDYTKDARRVFTDFPGAKIFAPNPLTSGGYRRNQSLVYRFKDRDFDPGIAQGNCWKHTVTTDDGSTSGMDRLAAAGRLFIGKKQLRFKRYVDDFGYKEITNWWDGLGGASDPTYVVQTNVEILRRCILMTTRPGDLVLDPTCGSGTTAYVAEQWGRRWITIDTSRVPLALARQRLLTATFPWYELVDADRGPSSGFVYKPRKNRSGEQVGGVVPHITSSTIANEEPPETEVLVDRPETEPKTTRVTGPFCVEATIPSPADVETLIASPEGENLQAKHESPPESFTDRMIEILRRSPLLRLPGNRSVELSNIRKPAKTLSLHAEALVSATAEGQEPTIADAAQEALEQSGGLLGGLTKRPVAFAFGPENGPVSQKTVQEAAMEARLKSYTHLYVIGFAIHPNARQLVENCESVAGIRATYVQMTPDVLMGDLLKNMRSSQIFSVCGLPEIELRKRIDGKYEVELLGLDVFDPATNEVNHDKGDEVPAWLLDTDYNGLCFHVCQAFFPRTAAWEGLKKALKADYEESVWDHLAGTISAPFEPNGHGEIAVKVIDDRGNELLVVKKVEDTRR